MFIYLADLKRLRIAEDYDELLSGMDEEAVKRIERFKFEKGRYMALMRQIVLDYVFYGAFGSCRVALKADLNGKPRIEGITGPDGKAFDNSAFKDFDFNISHSGEVLVIVSGKGRAGIDVEQASRIKDVDKLTRFFYKDEENRVNKAEDPKDEFCRIWTFREAFSKEEGVGIPLFENEEIKIDYDENKVFYKNTGFRFYEYGYPGFRITCCVKKDEEKPELLSIDETLWSGMTETVIKFAKARSFMV